MSTIKKLSHITLMCRDLNKSAKFLQKIFGAVEQYVTKERIYSIAPERFFKIGSLWIVIMQGAAATKTYNHIAFQVEAAKLSILHKRIVKLGLTILKGRKRKSGEGKSLYFYDYDNHLFELHSGNLTKRVKFYRDLDRQFNQARKV